MVVNVRATVPLDVKVNSRLAALPGLMLLENELMSTGVSDGEVIVAASSQAPASRATQQIAAILILMDVLRGS